MNEITAQSTFSTWQRRFRLAWYPALALALGILLASVPGYLFFSTFGANQESLVLPQGPAIAIINGMLDLVSFTSALLAIGLAILLFARKSDEVMGLFLSYYLLVYGVLLAGPIEELGYLWPEAYTVNSYLLLPFLLGPLTTALLGIFPSGRFVPGWAKWLVPYSLILFPLSYSLSDPTANPVLAGSSTIAGIVLLMGGFFAQIRRYRFVSSHAERQQTKIVVYGIALWWGLMALAALPSFWGYSQPPGTSAPWWYPLGSFCWGISILILPVALTVAVMRYRLFEIDVIIRRTLVYGMLTFLLATVFFGIVTLTQSLFVAVTGQESSAAIVLSTLSIAALFTPLRRRIQGAIDRRFYRRKYDSEKALADFSLAIRDEVDIERLSQALLAIIEETMQPENASVWLHDFKS